MYNRNADISYYSHKGTSIKDLRFQVGGYHRQKMTYLIFKYWKSADKKRNYAQKSQKRDRPFWIPLSILYILFISIFFFRPKHWDTRPFEISKCIQISVHRFPNAAQTLDSKRNTPKSNFIVNCQKISTAVIYIKFEQMFTLR